MGALEFISTIIGSVLSWPLVVAFALWLFREPLRELIEDVESATLPGSSSLKRRLRDARRNADQARNELQVGDTPTAPTDEGQDDPPVEEEQDDSPLVALDPGSTENPQPPQDTAATAPPPSTAQQWRKQWLDPKTLKSLLGICEVSPGAGVEETWRYLQEGLAEAVGPWNSGTSMVAFANRLRRLGELDILADSWVAGYSELRKVRNSVSHGTHKVSVQESRYYYGTARALLEGFPIEQVRAYRWRRGRPPRTSTNQ